MTLSTRPPPAAIAEIETSRLALEKSQSADIKAFANMMITDHSKANDELAAIAKRMTSKCRTTRRWSKQAKEKILDMRDESLRFGLCQQPGQGP